eukprot:TRINITY_DN12894_c0_g1_i1.p1 TRINITY_DN12894_c0_g1~~TRINITY_DN12894_c0_g1_i1.p1  ORF type:complete len:653 (-),score=88.05 TRINITY_DN12894_c0_g1_i1:167-2125(-)
MPEPPIPKIPCLPRLAEDDAIDRFRLTPDDLRVSVGQGRQPEQGRHQRTLGLQVLTMIKKHQLQHYREVEALLSSNTHDGPQDDAKSAAQQMKRSPLETPAMHSIRDRVPTPSLAASQQLSSDSDLEFILRNEDRVFDARNSHKKHAQGRQETGEYPEPLSPVASVADQSEVDQSEAARSTEDSGSDVSKVWSVENEAQFEAHLNLKREQNKLDLIVGIVIVANAACMMLQLEWQGTQSAGTLGILDNPDWGGAQSAFEAAEHAFTVFYIGELLLRLRSEGRSYFCQAFNMFDFLLVLLSAVELWILGPALGGELNTSVSELRSVRLIKIVKIARIIRAVRLLQGLRQLVTACTSALTALFWSVILLFLCIATASLTVGSLLQEFIQNPSNDYDERKWVWEHYGTALRSSLTLFEMTFAGNWPVYSRPVLEYAGGWYMICFALYIVVVVFATTRVIGAIFLKDALDATNSDPELMIHAKEMHRIKYMQKLADFFNAIDTTRDGNITRSELDNMLASPTVVAYLAVLDIELHEGSKLFDMLDDGDGNVTYKEFINGLFRFRGQARSVDLVELHMKLQYIEDVLTDKINELAEQIVGEVKATHKVKRRSHRRFTRMIHEEANLLIHRRHFSDSSAVSGSWNPMQMARGISSRAL